MPFEKCMATSKTPEWSTPQALYDELDDEFHFTLDPCATDDNAKCNTYFTKEQDGLSQDWTGHTVFMNPPYGRGIFKWIEKAWSEAVHATVVCLVPARTDTRWWHDFCMRGEVRFLRGRISFSGEGRAPFPSAIVIFRQRFLATRQPKVPDQPDRMQTFTLTITATPEQREYVEGIQKWLQDSLDNKTLIVGGPVDATRTQENENGSAKDD